MIRLHACTRCQGDLLFEEDVWGGPPALVCLQCGNTIALGRPAAIAAFTLRPQGSHRSPRRRSGR
jgi:hypothetical protein